VRAEGRRNDDERLLSRRWRALLVAVAAALFTVAIPLVGLAQTLGALLIGFASLFLTIAIAEDWIHRRQQEIEERRVQILMKTVALDLMFVAQTPVECLGTVLPDWYGRFWSRIDPDVLLQLVEEIRGHFCEAETRALVKFEGYLDWRTTTDEQLEELGLPARERMRWCSSSIADVILYYRVDLPDRILAARLDEQTAGAARRMLRELPALWTPLAHDQDPGPSIHAFLSASALTLQLSQEVLRGLDEMSEDLRPSLLIPAVAVGEPKFTTWDKVRTAREEQ
jgi:hypothetical protein